MSAWESPSDRTDVTSLEMTLQKTEKKTKSLLCVVFWSRSSGNRSAFMSTPFQNIPMMAD